MAAHKADGASEESDGFVFVYDRRESDAPEVKVSLKGISSLKAFKEHLAKVILIIYSHNFIRNLAKNCQFHKYALQLQGKV